MSHLHLYDNNYKGSGFGRDALTGVFSNFCAEYDVIKGLCTRPAKNRVAYPASSFSDILKSIEKAGSDKGKLDSITFHAHGHPGRLSMGLDKSNVGALRGVCAKYLKSPANVYFYACNVGEGEKGQSFLKAASKAILSHGGGKAFAYDSKLYTFPFLATRAPAWGNVVVCIVKRGGKDVRIVVV